MVATASTLFGLNGNLSRLLFDDGVSPVTLVEFRMLIGAICLLGVLIIGQRKGLKVPRRSWGWIRCNWVTLLPAGCHYLHRIPFARTPGRKEFALSHFYCLWSARGKHILVQRTATMGNSGKYLDAISSRLDHSCRRHRYGDPVFTCAGLVKAHRCHTRRYREYVGVGSCWGHCVLLVRPTPGLATNFGMCAGGGGNYHPAIRKDLSKRIDKG
jgi:hypothetical protein